VYWKKIKPASIALIFVIILNVLFNAAPVLYDKLYFRGLFQAFRVLHDFTIGFLPIPSLYIILVLFFWLCFRNPRKSWSWWIFSIINCFIWIVVLFYITWAYNYKQISLYERLDLEVPQLDSVYITTNFRTQTALLSEIKDQMAQQVKRDDVENDIRLHQEALLQEWDIPTWGRVRVRKIWPGILLHFRTSGIYIPHAFEGHLDRGLYFKQHPFTMAHEMSHGYGITDESVANFVAYLTCIRSDNLEIRYSAELAYWRYLASYYKRFHRETWKSEYGALDIRLKEDLEAISDHISRYKDLMPKYRDVIYDSYLKKHGVKAGIKSYDQMIMLIAAYRRANQNQNGNQNKN